MTKPVGQASAKLLAEIAGKGQGLTNIIPVVGTMVFFL